VEGQTPSDILILLEGHVKLFINSSNGKRLILRVARPGEILGLISALSGSPYGLTAEALHLCSIASLRRPDFLGFLSRHPAAGQSVVSELNVDYNRACERLRTIGLASSARAKLARLLLEWCTCGRQTECGTRFHISLTHEEIGECIGVSRETVTRILSGFKRRQMADLHGSTLTISNRAALEHCAGA
jgi:CRP/FNR family transcriptional regulator